MNVRDFLGRPICEGDRVVFIEHSSTSSNFKSGVVIKTNPKTVEIEGERGHKTRKEGYKVIVQPAADVVPVVHGEWLDCECHDDIVQCSACGDIYKRNLAITLYSCPSCNAKMDGGNHEN